VRADSYILPECLVKPGSFGGLMALYEANFIKLNQLIEELSSCAGAGMSSAIDDCDLYLSVETRTRHTIELRLTYLFPDAITGEVAEPDLLAKVYFDARMVEVAGWKNAHRHQLLRQFDLSYERPLDWYWVRNNMLGKWLDYLLDQGHKFDPASLISS
jgi:uncharacterized protein YqiB (DUF1249 family)